MCCAAMGDPAAQAQALRVLALSRLLTPFLDFRDTLSLSETSSALHQAYRDDLRRLAVGLPYWEECPSNVQVCIYATVYPLPVRVIVAVNVCTFCDAFRLSRPSSHLRTRIWPPWSREARRAHFHAFISTLIY